MSSFIRKSLWLATALLSVSAQAETLTLADQGKTDYRIVVPDQLKTGEPLVLKELQTHLKAATGADFGAVRQSAQPTEKRIYLGISPDGFRMDTLAEQEHCVMTRGKDLFLFGKGLNGARYAVYDFLQKDLGFRFYDARGGMKIPQTPKLQIQDLNRRTKFDFEIRRTTQYWLFNLPQATYFQYRNGQNNAVTTQPFMKTGVPTTPDDYRALYPAAHSLAWYIPTSSKARTFKWIRQEYPDQNLWKEHPEYFTMNSDGKRQQGRQYCMSNPGLRKLLAERILENMKRNPDMNSFDVSANDTPGRFCSCPDCLVLEKKYGSIGGPLFDFFLEFCPVAAKKFPGKYITTLIYRKNQTQKPPENIRFPENFVAVFAPINDNFAEDWNHPDNRETYEDLKKWCEITGKVLVWYYPNPYTKHINPPFGNVERMVNDIRLMKEAGVAGMVWEHNVGVPEMIGFTEMQSWLALQLFQNVNLPWKDMADEFISFEYGKAAPLMKKYWLELEKLRKTGTFKMPWNPDWSCFSYLTPERLLRWNSWFDQMEALVKDSPRGLFSVQRVRVNLDLALLQYYAKLKQTDPAFGSSYEQIEKRLVDSYRKSVGTLFNSQFSRIQQDRLRILQERLLPLRLVNTPDAKPLPQEIFGKTDPKMLFVSLPKVNGSSYIKDPDAAFGWCAVFSRPEPKGLPFNAYFKDIYYGKYPPQPFGSVSKEALGPRGKYKFYRLGRIRLSPDCALQIGANNAWDFRTPIGEAYTMGAFNNADAYASLKFEGPAFYPEDAGKKNVVYCDRIVIVRLD